VGAAAELSADLLVTFAAASLAEGSVSHTELAAAAVTGAGAGGGASSKGEPAAALTRGSDSNRERGRAAAESTPDRTTVWAYLPLGSSVIGTD
jgi:hypothetical protein